MSCGFNIGCCDLTALVYTWVKSFYRFNVGGPSLPKPPIRQITNLLNLSATYEVYDSYHGEMYFSLQ